MVLMLMKKKLMAGLNEYSDSEFQIVQMKTMMFFYVVLLTC